MNFAGETTMIRTLSAAALVVALALLSVPSAGAQKPAIKPDTAPYVHSVVFYLKKDAPKDAADKLIVATNDLLRKIPTVRGLWVGQPASKATPKVAVLDYQVGLLVLFDDAQGLETYLNHPLHVEFVEKHTKNVERVLVYDFVNQQPKLK
jgi:hypothetical protein